MELTASEHQQALKIAYYKSLKRGDGSNPPAYNHDAAVGDFWAAAGEVISGRGKSVFCNNCGTPLDEGSNLQVADRTPCPNCGGLSRRIEATASGGLVVTGRASVELTPGAQARDWRQRLQELKSHLDRLRALRSEPLSGETIQNANHDIQSFFIQAYHLKDSLIQDSHATGIPANTIENAITTDPNLALLADLANLDKHGRLTKPPRSGAIPSWRVSGVDDSDAGWRLSLRIRHQGNELDGLVFAGHAVAAWEGHLRLWGLI